MNLIKGELYHIQGSKMDLNCYIPGYSSKRFYDLEFKDYNAVFLGYLTEMNFRNNKFSTTTYETFLKTMPSLTIINYMFLYKTKVFGICFMYNTDKEKVFNRCFVKRFENVIY